jgi:hypothetical protein
MQFRVSNFESTSVATTTQFARLLRFAARELREINRFQFETQNSVRRIPFQEIGCTKNRCARVSIIYEQCSVRCDSGDLGLALRDVRGLILSSSRMTSQRFPALPRASWKSWSVTWRQRWPIWSPVMRTATFRQAISGPETCSTLTI